MKITHELEQGTPSWHTYRAEHFGASEAAAMLGISKYCSRSELLKRKATGIEPEISPALQAVFDRGHATEIGGREMAEKIIGQPLYPVTVSEGKLSASCDGLTLTEDMAFEHKQYRADLADSVSEGILPAEHHPQCQQVMMVTGAEKLLFMVSDGTPDNCAYMWVIPSTEWRRNLTQGWTQFAIDLQNYVHVDVTVEPTAATIEALPALMIQVEGKVLATNLDQFKASAQTFIANINTDLQTDQDFADADKMVKFLKDGEERLALCKSQALSQTASIDELFRTIDAISGQMKDKRLMLDKLVAAEKTNRKQEIISTATKEVVAHTEKLNQRIGGNWMPPPKTGLLVEAVRGLKSLDSMRDKVSAALANAKVEANEIADRIEINRKVMENLCDPILFPDFAAVCTKPSEDFAALVAMRVSQDQQRKEAERLAAEAKTAAAVASAVEAERIAEAKRVADVQAKAREEADRITREATRADAETKAQAANDQRAKTGDTTHAEPNATALPQVTPASSPPIPSDEAAIDDFIGLLPMTDTEKRAHRLTVIKWEKYRVALLMKVAA